MALRGSVLLLSLWTFIPGAIASPCSSDNRTSDLSQCLSTMINIAKDKTSFWYGTSYPARCPNPWGSVDCFNPHPYRADSLVSRVFGPGYVLQDSLITQFLSVTFETGTGSYSGCGNIWTVTENRRIDLDPAVTDIYRPWSVRNRPTMTWSANQSELYTLIVFDTGYLINHGIFLNIPGNNISQSEIFKDFNGPRPTRATPNVYAFLLFKQSGRIQLSEEWRQKLANSMITSEPNPYNMTEAINYLNLTGPVAMNWMSIAIDAYAVQLMINDRILFACPNLVSEALKNHNRAFIPKGASMTVSVDVTFSPSAVTFTSCCTTYSKPQRSFQLNPLGDASVGSWDVRSDANPAPDLSALGFYMQRKNFTGKTFTLLCVDPDVPRATAGTQERPLLHWMVVNIPEGRVAEGDTVMTYRGPQPPDTAHYYYFLLYEQKNSINSTEAANYTSPPISSGIDEELEVLKSIYIEELNISLSERSQPEVISLRLHPSTGDEVEKKYVCITLELQLSQQYPHEIPTIDIKNPRGIGEEEVNRLQKSLVTLATELQGGPMLYDLIELAKEKLTEGNIPHCPCTICYEHFHEGEEFTKTHCYHYFHCHCLARYVRHALASIQQENQSRPTHQQDGGGQTKVPCPVCREEMECNVELFTWETTPQDQSLNFHPTAELRTWQREMSRLLRRQRERGGVIDVQEERNKFLITQDDVVELNLTSIQDTDPESSTKHSTESSVKHSTEASTKDQGTIVTVKDSGKSRNTGILNKPKTTFKASRLPQQIQMLDREFDRRWTGFSEEFENLNRRGAPGGSKREGQRPENRHKNRVKHLVPYDDTRVVLKDGDSEVKGSDYICAAYIQITSETARADGGRLIATQGCLSETVGDFWRMVWQERSQVIIMATKAVEDDRVKVSHYWCEEGEERLLEGQNYKFQVKGQSVSPHRDYVLRELEVTRLSGEGQGEGSRLVYQFNFTAWPDFGVPKNPAAIIDFLATVNSKQAELTEAGPIVIHCSAGLGRTGTLVAIEALIHQIKEEGLDCDLDIQKTVLKVRSQRPGMIQTEPQYKFIYKALLSYLQSQPGFTPEQGTLDSYHEEAHRQRFIPKDRRGRGRGRPVNQRSGDNDRLSRARDTQSRPGNLEHSDEGQSGKSHTDIQKTNSLMDKNTDEVTLKKSQERRGFGKPKSSQKAERNQSESHETGGAEENAAPEMSKDSINEKRKNEETRKGFGRPRSGQVKKSDQGHHESRQQRSPRNQRDTGDSQDSSTQRETRKGFGKPPERHQHDKGDRMGKKEDTRSGFGQPPRGGDGRVGRGKNETRPMSGGKQSRKDFESRSPREKREQRGASKPLSGYGGNMNRNTSDQNQRPHKRLEEGSHSSNKEETDNVNTRNNGGMKSETRKENSDRTSSCNEGTSGADSELRKGTTKLRAPPGFNISGPPSGFGDPVSPPPGFSKLS